MIFYYLFMTSLFVSDKLCIFPETPKKFQALKIEGSVLIAKEQSFTLQLRFLAPGEFYLFCREKGLPDSLLASAEIKEKFTKWFSVECKVVNLSTELMYINPLHMVIQNNRQPVGNLVEPGFYLTQKTGQQNDRLQAISNLFDQTSIEVPAGETRIRVLTFRPVGKAFPMRTLNFIIDHIYVGIEKYHLEGRISLKPCSKK